jgi:ABC-type polysaccharide/polyol phosphate export permease
METEHDILYRNWNQDEIVSTNDWLITLLVMLTPILNIIMILRWSLSPDTNPNKLNFIKAGVIAFMLLGAGWWLVTHL